MKKQQNEPVSASSTQSDQELNPKTTSYEFLGPVGAFGFITVLPALVLFFACCCDATGYPSKRFMQDWKGFLFSEIWIKRLIDPVAMAVYLGFIGFLVVLYYVLKADIVPGTVLRNGQRLKYRLNGKKTKRKKGRE